MSAPVPQGSILILTTELGKAPDFKAALRIWAAHLVTPNPLLPPIDPDDYDTMDWCAARALNPGDEGYTYHRTDTAIGTNWGFYTTGGRGDDEMGAVLDGVSRILDGVGMMDAAGVLSAVAA